MSCRRFAGRPVRIEAAAVGEIDVEPSVVVVVEKGDAAALGLDDDALVFDAAPDIRNVQAGLLCHIDELDGRRWRGGDCGLHLERSPSFHKGVVSVSSRALPSTKSEDPRKRRRGMIIGFVDYR